MIGLASMLLAAQLARADALAAPPGDHELEDRGAVIDRITVRVGDIFDPSVPEEDRTLFRWANRLHRETRDRVILDQLLFAPGDRYSRRVLDESERLLRADPYLYDAEIRPVRRHGDKVDVEVFARDVWTLEAGVGFGRKGGANETRFKLEDANFLGTGKSVALEHSTDVDRSGTEIRFVDPNLRGGHGRVDAGFADNSDGSRWHLRIGRPFYALDSRWAAGGAVLDDDRIDARYRGGIAVERFRHRETEVELSGGLSHGLLGGAADRWTAGVTWSHDRLAPLAEGPSPASPPLDRTLVYPWIGFEHVEDAYREATDLDKIGRTEDLFVGRSFRGRIGWSSSAFGGDGERLIFDGAARAAWELADRQLIELSGHAGGRWGGGGAEDLEAGCGAVYHRRDFGSNVFYAALAFDLAANLDPDHQLTLGGDNGLRGYPLRYQDGDRRLLLTVEQRFFSDWRPFHLVQVGAAVFADAGRSWFADGRDGGPGGTLTDVGIGLRLGHTRSGHGSMIHLDLAFPVGADGSIDSPQWLVSSKDSF